MKSKKYSVQCAPVFHYWRSELPFWICPVEGCKNVLISCQSFV